MNVRDHEEMANCQKSYQNGLFDGMKIMFWVCLAMVIVAGIWL